jgi:hypothetical protein
MPNKPQKKTVEILNEEVKKYILKKHGLKKLKEYQWKYNTTKNKVKRLYLITEYLSPEDM